MTRREFGASAAALLGATELRGTQSNVTLDAYAAEHLPGQASVPIHAISSSNQIVEIRTYSDPRASKLIERLESGERLIEIR